LSQPQLSVIFLGKSWTSFYFHSILHLLHFFIILHLLQPLFVFFFLFFIFVILISRTYFFRSVPKQFNIITFFFYFDFSWYVDLLIYFCLSPSFIFLRYFFKIFGFCYFVFHLTLIFLFWFFKVLRHGRSWLTFRSMKLFSTIKGNIFVKYWYIDIVYSVIVWF
jgi:hypothetical protein